GRAGSRLVVGDVQRDRVKDAVNAVDPRQRLVVQRVVTIDLGNHVERPGDVDDAIDAGDFGDLFRKTRAHRAGRGLDEDVSLHDGRSFHERRARSRTITNAARCFRLRATWSGRALFPDR